MTSTTAAIVAPNRLLRAALRRFSSGASPTVCDPYQHCRNCLPGVDEVTLVARGGDYVPIAEHLIEQGLKFDVAFWDHANHELKKACSKFISLNQFLDHLRWSGEDPDVQTIRTRLLPKISLFGKYRRPAPGVPQEPWADVEFWNTVLGRKYTASLGITGYNDDTYNASVNTSFQWEDLAMYAIANGVRVAVAVNQDDDPTNKAFCSVELLPTLKEHSKNFYVGGDDPCTNGTSQGEPGYRLRHETT